MERSEVINEFGAEFQRICHMVSQEVLEPFSLFAGHGPFDGYGLMGFGFNFHPVRDAFILRFHGSSMNARKIEIST